MSGKRLLLIEDDHDVADMLHVYFGAHEFDIVHADTGRGGIEMARSLFPALILLDVMLPDLDGFSVCQELRQIAITRYIPVIFLTYRDERASKMLGLRLGADDYITKPFDVDELRLRIQSALKRATGESLHEARTGLPTGVLVQEEIARRRSDQATFAEIHLSLDRFHDYSEVYGFMASDEVLAYTAHTIREAIALNGTAQDFVGFDGEQFILLTHSPNANELVDTVCSRCNEGLKAFYSFQDVEQGGLIVNTSTDVRELVPLMQLTVT
jgi:DNA-binding response OmpR family regulator